MNETTTIIRASNDQPFTLPAALPCAFGVDFGYDSQVAGMLSVVDKVKHDASIRRRQNTICALTPVIVLFMHGALCFPRLLANTYGTRNDDKKIFIG